MKKRLKLREWIAMALIFSLLITLIAISLSTQAQIRGWQLSASFFPVCGGGLNANVNFNSGTFSGRFWKKERGVIFSIVGKSINLIASLLSLKHKANEQASAKLS